MKSIQTGDAWVGYKILQIKKRQFYETIDDSTWESQFVRRISRITVKDATADENRPWRCELSGNRIGLRSFISTRKVKGKYWSFCFLVLVRTLWNSSFAYHNFSNFGTLVNRVSFLASHRQISRLVSINLTENNQIFIVRRIPIYVYPPSICKNFPKTTRSIPLFSAFFLDFLLFVLRFEWTR